MLPSTVDTSMSSEVPLAAQGNQDAMMGEAQGREGEVGRAVETWRGRGFTASPFSRAGHRGPQQRAVPEDV